MARKRERRKKVRVDFRPNLQKPARKSSSAWTKQRRDRPADVEDAPTGEMVKGKGALARKRTVSLSAARQLGELQRKADESCPPEQQWAHGVVTAIHGHFAVVDHNGEQRNCVTRKVLKSLLVGQRNVIAVGDNVFFTPIGDDEGVIERIEQRKGMLYRRSRERAHLIVTNIDQVVIVSSVATPELRIHLVDRYIVAALAGDLRPVIVFNKVDLDHDYPLDDYQRVYSSLGYTVLRTSTVTETGITELRETMKDCKSVLAGVSGVGKSSLINVVDSQLNLAVKPVNRASGRGQHTTTTVRLLRLGVGGYVVDTPGIRQFAFWNIDRRNIEEHFEEFLPYISNCKFPDCTHTHEQSCAVIQAVTAGSIAQWRYDSYAKMFNDAREFMSSWEL